MNVPLGWILCLMNTPPPRIVNLKQHKIPGRWKEILALINVILEVPANVLYDSSVWPFSVKKADGSWTQTVGYWGLNKAVLPIAPAAPEMVPTVQKLPTRGEWSAVIDPAIPTSVNCNLPAHGTDPCSDPRTSTVLPQSYLNSPSYCYDLVRKDLSSLQAWVGWYSTLISQ